MLAWYPRSHVWLFMVFLLLENAPLCTTTRQEEYPISPFPAPTAHLSGSFGVNSDMFFVFDDNAKTLSIYDTFSMQATASTSYSCDGRYTTLGNEIVVVCFNYTVMLFSYDTSLKTIKTTFLGNLPEDFDTLHKILLSPKYVFVAVISIKSWKAYRATTTPDQNIDSWTLQAANPIFAVAGDILFYASSHQEEIFYLHDGNEIDVQQCFDCTIFDHSSEAIMIDERRFVTWSGISGMLTVWIFSNRTLHVFPMPGLDYYLCNQNYEMRFLPVSGVTRKSHPADTSLLYSVYVSYNGHTIASIRLTFTPDVIDLPGRILQGHWFLRTGHSTWSAFPLNDSSTWPSIVSSLDVLSFFIFGLVLAHPLWL